MRARVVLALCLAMLLSGCASSGQTITAGVFQPPEGWQRIDAQGHFTFWVPAGLAPQEVHGTDSYVGIWTSDNVTVRFDYGMYSGGMDSAVKARPHSETAYRLDGVTGAIVQFTDENGLLIAELLLPHITSATNLTFEVSASPSLGKDLPLQIVRSVRLTPDSGSIYPPPHSMGR
ncbi:MAG TPA: hypothetical protein VF807_09145 [Ktedonobacterales bacterium]